MKRQNSLSPPTKSKIFEAFSAIHKKGGPDVTDYSILNKYINAIPSLLRHGVISTGDIETIKGQCEFLQFDLSVMGHIKLRPFGYPGDYQIIERIYQNQVSEKYRKWDQYSMANPAAEAVRNRKQFFKTLINTLLQQQAHIELLNVASGPARDLKEIYDEIDQKRLTTTCVEIDERAIDYARTVCKSYSGSIRFINQNVFRFQTRKKFDMIWSAGLFDYFNDKTFVQLLKKLQGSLKTGGEICIGNFSTNNPGRVYMEVFGEWFLTHRTEEELRQLALMAGAELSEISIDREPLKVNLFLRVKKSTQGY
jgi:extracellular factor (EF) 3-hydroxypalmitic acid methyl ester biosynthesis protein